MKNLVCSTIAFLGLAVLTLAGSVSYVSTWKNPIADPLDRTGKKVATFVISADESMRLGPEETLAAELCGRGVDCVAGKEEELRDMPGTAWYAGPYCAGFWGYWDYSWSTSTRRATEFQYRRIAGDAGLLHRAGFPGLGRIVQDDRSE
ncbi:MAG TPA: hypothetical protein PLN26_14980 [Acidobacteriota bacterium]|nr:hypothetical protein [Acidobacteriota bacterium]HQF88526.1 hypothetical protein [Acidobacteriota bacterium]HQG92794.1 hypothetical protein [Acidobacteriota bacterium]